MKPFLLLLFIVAFLSADIIEELRGDLDSIEAEATKTKQNIDYKPYIISVFRNDELLRLGILNLADALAIVPGVDMASDNLSVKTPVFRGSNPFAFGQSKLFIDGVERNQLFFDGYSSWLNMPVHLIKRIEVIRGPSIMDDSTASFAGSINVITFAEDRNNNDAFVFAEVGSDAYKTGGFVKHFDLEELQIYTSFYYKEHKQSVYLEHDGLYSGVRGEEFIHLSKSGDAPLFLDSWLLSVQAEYKNIEFLGEFLGSKSGAAYGSMYALPNETDFTEIPQYNLEATYSKSFGKDLNARFKVGLEYEKFYFESILYPDGTVFEGVFFPDGLFGDISTSQRKIYHSTVLQYQGFNDHDIRFSYKLQRDETLDQKSFNTNRQTGIGLIDYSDTIPIFDENAKRETFSFYLNDEYRYSDKLNFLVGLGFSDSDNFEHILSSRLATVYRYNNEQIFKLTYTNSYRLPSWQEIYIRNNSARIGNQNLSEEKVDAFEASYIYKPTIMSTFKSSLFYIKNRDEIERNEDLQYANLRDRDIYGLELELSTSFTNRDKFWLTYSLLDSSKGDLAYTSKQLLKSYYTYDFDAHLRLSLISRFSSKKNRFEYEKRDKVDEMLTLDTTLSYKEQNYRVEFGVKNLFDAKEVYASSPDSGYIDDYPRVGRSLYLSLKREF